MSNTKKINISAHTIILHSEREVNCIYNGKHEDENGNLIECCCDECDYYLECFPSWNNKTCDF